MACTFTAHKNTAKSSSSLFFFTFTPSSVWFVEPTMLPLVDESVWHILNLNALQTTHNRLTSSLSLIHTNITKIKLIFALNTCFQVGWFFVVFLRVFPVHPLLFATLNAHQVSEAYVCTYSVQSIVHTQNSRQHTKTETETEIEGNLLETNGKKCVSEWQRGREKR